MVALTQHAVERGRERHGLKRRSLERVSSRAFSLGKRAKDYSGRIRRYLDMLHMQEEGSRDICVYGQQVYIFKEGGFLITTFTLPNELKKAA